MGTKNKKFHLTKEKKRKLKVMGHTVHRGNGLWYFVHGDEIPRERNCLCSKQQDILVYIE